MTTRQAQRRHELGNPISGHGVTTTQPLHDHHQTNGAFTMAKPNAATAAPSTQETSPIWSQVEQLSLKLGVLEALLINTNGVACESFNDMEEDMRDAYLSHCADLAITAKAEATRITEAALALAHPAKATA